MRNPLKFLGKALSATPEGMNLLQAYRGGFFAFPRSAYVDGVFFQVQSAQYAAIYAQQPHVRTVVDFIASNVASQGMKLYKRDPSGYPEEDPTHPAAQTMFKPNDWQGHREHIEALLKDWLIYDNAYDFKAGRIENDQLLMLRVPSYAVGVGGTNFLVPSIYRVQYRDGSHKDFPASDVVHIRGYSGLDPRQGTSKLETLRQELIAEATRQAADIEFNRSGRVKGGIIERPAEAPDWGNEARERFEADWASRIRGTIKGAALVLEDGMTFTEAGVTPKDAEVLQSKELSLATVARTYGLHPSLFGVDTGEGATLDECWKAAEEGVFYPLARRFAEAYDVQMLAVDYDAQDTHYFEFSARPEGDYGKLLASLVSAVGGPIMKRNEARRKLNLPPTEDGEEMITPLNVTQGGQASPNHPNEPSAAAGQTRGRPAGSENDPNAPDKASDLEGKMIRKQNGKWCVYSADGSQSFGCYSSRAAAQRRLRQVEHYGSQSDTIESKMADDVRGKALRRQATMRRRDEYAGDYASAFRRHFKRQLRSVRAGGKSGLDTARWNDELAADLLKLDRAVVGREGLIVGERLILHDGSGGSFDLGQVENYLKVAAEETARGVNIQTQRDAAASGKDAKERQQEALATAIDERSDQLGQTRATHMSSFAAMEAGKQNTGPAQLRVKEWVWSGSANSRHGGVAGEGVPLFSEFSNGMQYPGDPAGGVEQTARCECALDIF